VSEPPLHHISHHGIQGPTFTPQGCDEQWRWERSFRTEAPREESIAHGEYHLWLERMTVSPQHSHFARQVKERSVRSWRMYFPSYTRASRSSTFHHLSHSHQKLQFRLWSLALAKPIVCLIYIMTSRPVQQQRRPSSCLYLPTVQK